MPHTYTRLPIQKHVTARELVQRHCADILASDGMAIERACIQHGTTSVFAHSIAVTHACAKLARTLRIPVHERALMRGALLHDYFLYDWHDGKPARKIHGFTHPGFACKNAIRDFQIGSIEQNMVRRHMFPLTPVPPACREAVILCVADKYVAAKETLCGFARKLARQSCSKDA